MLFFGPALATPTPFNLRTPPEISLSSAIFPCARGLPSLSLYLYLFLFLSPSLPLFLSPSIKCLILILCGVHASVSPPPAARRVHPAGENRPPFHQPASARAPRW